MFRPAKLASFIAGAAIAATLTVSPVMAQMTGKDADAVKRISQHFSGVPSMMGEFIQFGPNGEQTGGKFYLKRPGKIRFDYEKPSPILVKADGKTVAIHNRKLKTWDYAPLSKTPLRLLLSDRIDINDKSIRGVQRDSDLTTVFLANKSLFGNAKIKLMFDPKSYELRQWTITDDQGKDTSVMIFNVKNNVKLRDRIFKIDQLANQRNSRSSDR